MSDPLTYAAKLRQLADDAEPRQYSITLGITEARTIAQQLEQLVHDVAMLRSLVHDAQNDYRNLPSAQRRKDTP